MSDTSITFNPSPQIQGIRFPNGQACFIIDNALVNPEVLVQLANDKADEFQTASFNAYPGVQLPMAADITRLDEFFTLHIRGLVNARRTVRMHNRLAMVTMPPEQLQPRQWMPHRDSAGLDPGQCIAASVLYLFHDESLGGTSFFMPKKSTAETSLLVHDSGTIGRDAFAQKYNIAPGYCSESNDYFEKLYTVPAKWNRMVFYDGSIFHSGDIPHPEKMNTDPLTGRLTLNGFFICTRKAV
jgi:Family of unknown function (DUF6445)